MSLLLDALKQAENRGGRTAARPGATASSGPDTHPAQPAAESHVLAILEDHAPVPDVAITAAAAPAADASGKAGALQASQADHLAGRQARSHVPQSKPGAARQKVLLLTLLVTIAAIGAAWYLLGGEPQLAQLAPPLPADAAVAAAPVESVAAEGADDQDFVLPEPTFVPAQEPEAVRAVPAIQMPRESVKAAAEAVEPPAPAVVVRPVSVTVSAPRIWLQDAYDALQAGRLEQAENNYQEILRAEPHQVDAHLGLAVIAQARNDRATALNHYRQVLEDVPDHARAWAGIADLAGAAEIEAMESRLRGLIATRPSASLQFALGNVLARQSRWAEAQETYFSAAAGSPGNPDYAFNLAVALDHLGKREVAAPWYERAIQSAQGHGPVQFDLEAARRRLAVLREPVP